MPYLPRDVRDGLDAARGDRSGARRRLHVRTGGQDVVVLRHWTTGFAVAAEDAPALRGRVDLYDGARLLCRALVLASGEEGGERHFEFKYATRGAEDAPPADFARDEAAPAGLLPAP